MPVDVPDKRNRLLKNSLYGLFSWLLPVLTTIFATRIVVKGLGNEQYGVYVAILGFISYFFTIGIGKVVAKYVAEYRASGETGKLSEIISATILIGVSVTMVGSLVTILLARTIVVDLLFIPPELQNNAVVGLYLACATIMSIMLGQIFQLALQGLNRFDLYLLLTNLSSVLFSVGSIVLVVLGFGVAALLVWNLVVTIAVGILSFILAKRLLPEFRFTFSVSGDALRAVYVYAASIAAYQTFGNILLLFERAWIIRKFGAGNLTYYAVPMLLAMYVHLFAGSLVLAMFPMVNELLTDRAKLIVLYQKSTKLILLLVVFAVLSVIVCGRMFLGLWLGNDFETFSYSILVVHVITFALLGLSTISWQVTEGFKAAGLNAFATFLWMAVAIPLMIFLSGEWQTFGVAIGRLAGILVFVPLIFYIEKRFLGAIFWRFWGSISIKLIFAAALAVLAELGVIAALNRSWGAFALSMLAGSVVFGGALITIGFFDSAEKQVFKDLIEKYR